MSATESNHDTAAMAGLNLHGFNHIALVCADMGRTVDFYTGVLDMPLLKTLDLGGGFGQHFFFDCGGGDCIAFFWFPKAPAAAPGIAAPTPDFESAGFGSAHGSLNFLSVAVDPARLDSVTARLGECGVAAFPLAADSALSAIAGCDRGIFFFDPDGIRVELVAHAKAGEVNSSPVEPKTADGVHANVLYRPHPAERPIVYGGEGVAA